MGERNNKAITNGYNYSVLQNISKIYEKLVYLYNYILCTFVRARTEPKSLTDAAAIPYSRSYSHNDNIYWPRPFNETKPLKYGAHGPSTQVKNSFICDAVDF